LSVYILILLQHKKALQGTILYLGIYAFWIIPFQIVSKLNLYNQKKATAAANKKQDGERVVVSYRATKYYNSKDMKALTGDRSVGNFIEFAILFLPLMWLHALLVDPTKSFSICAVYALTRAFYPLLFPKGILLLGSTIPGYLTIGYLFWELSKAAFF
jgi:hypothetical protein